MRLNTDGKFAWRKEEIQETAELLGINKTAAVLTACEHLRQDYRAKQRALEHPDMSAELAEILSTPAIALHHRVETQATLEP